VPRLVDIRTEYSHPFLVEPLCSNQFEEWFRNADQAGMYEEEAQHESSDQSDH
jgi:hypothetical protein